MSERDDDEYLWTGSGPASSEVARLEKLMGGEKLTARMRARPRRPMLLAIVVAALTAAAAYGATHHLVPPDSWLGAALPGVSSDELDDDSYVFELVDDAPPDGWERAIEERLREYQPSSIRFEGRRVRVDFTDGSPGGLEEEFGRRGEFAIKEVVEGSELMKALYARVSQGDSRAAELGVTAEIDSWDHDETGKQYTDYFLTASSEEALRRYFDEVAADPSFRPDQGNVIAFEQTKDDSRPVRWRSYLLEQDTPVSSGDVANAFVYWNDTTNSPEVLVELTAEGGERFADLTGSIVGRKLAMLLDGRVNSAPVVQDRIEGGRTSITMGSGTVEERQDEAQALVIMLRAGQRPLPVALKMIDRTFGGDRVSERQIRAAQAVFASLLGLLVFAAIWIPERRSRGIDPEVAPVRGRPRRRSIPWIRLAVSAAGATAAILAQRVPVTGDVDWTEIMGSGHISMFALGIVPALTAFLLVEVAALAVPRWRRLRQGGPSARARLGSATAVLTILLAAIQAWLIADFMLSTPPLAHLSRTVLVLSFTGGAVMMTFLALVISRYGLGNGFAILLLAGFGEQVHRAVHAHLSLGSFGPMAWGFEQLIVVTAAVTATVIATSWTLRHRLRGTSSASSIRLPTAGIVPVAVLPALLALLALAWPEAAGRLGVWWQESVARPGSGLLVELGFLVAVGGALSWLFSRPSRLGHARATGPGDGVWRTFAAATAVSIGYLALVGMLDRSVRAELGTFGLTLVPVVFATAILMDLIAEWRAFARRDDLIPIWPLHQVQRVDLVTGALTRNGIDVHTRGLYLRLMLHFTGPFSPVLLYVPAAQAEEARAIIRAQLEAT